METIKRSQLARTVAAKHGITGDQAARLVNMTAKELTYGPAGSLTVDQASDVSGVIMMDLKMDRTATLSK